MELVVCYHFRLRVANESLSVLGTRTLPKSGDPKELQPDKLVKKGTL